jgi:hypothetical protein
MSAPLHINNPRLVRALSSGRIIYVPDDKNGMCQTVYYISSDFGKWEWCNVMRETQTASLHCAPSKYSLPILCLLMTDMCFTIFYYYYYLFKVQMGFYPVAVYYNNTPHSNKHSTQNYTNNERTHHTQ